MGYFSVHPKPVLLVNAHTRNYGGRRVLDSIPPNKQDGARQNRGKRRL